MIEVIDLLDEIAKQKQEIESLRTEVEHQRKKIADNDAVSEHDWQQQTEAYNALLVKRDKWKRRCRLVYNQREDYDGYSDETVAEWFEEE